VERRKIPRRPRGKRTIVMCAMWQLPLGLIDREEIKGTLSMKITED